MSPLCFPDAPVRSAAAFPPAPETHSTKTDSGSHQTPRADFPRPKSRRPGRRRPAPLSAESILQVPVVQPFLCVTRITFRISTPLSLIRFVSRFDDITLASELLLAPNNPIHIRRISFNTPVLRYVLTATWPVRRLNMQ